ncbi:hypothetical protein HF576_19335 [Microbacterium sp. CFH 90308]|uniref:Uncharacterized protein n=1 Tax=Microbacterium salsuginis TaxID=2722803 RepID=A0ABX1KFZ5_9MICO|nr:hypothetical protein [Microbacterium sp. CFH 90308]NLP85991.1 hypothetical protein [Microbacterium sp. CFH 90308]
MREHVMELACDARALLLLGGAPAGRELRARIPSPMAKQTASASVATAIRTGCHCEPVSSAPTIAASQARPTAERAQMRAPRTTAPMIAKARAAGGGPNTGGTKRSTVTSAATTATVGPGQRRAARRARADAAARAMLVSAAGSGTCCHHEAPIVPGTWISSETTTGTTSPTAVDRRKREPDSSHVRPGMGTIVRRARLCGI